MCGLAQWRRDRIGRSEAKVRPQPDAPSRFGLARSADLAGPGLVMPGADRPHLLAAQLECARACRSVACLLMRAVRSFLPLFSDLAVSLPSRAIWPIILPL